MFVSIWVSRDIGGRLMLFSIKRSATHSCHDTAHIIYGLNLDTWRRANTWSLGTSPTETVSGVFRLIRFYGSRTFSGPCHNVGEIRSWQPQLSTDAITYPLNKLNEKTVARCTLYLVKNLSLILCMLGVFLS